MHCPFCRHGDSRVVDSRTHRRRHRDPPAPSVPGVRAPLHHPRDGEPERAQALRAPPSRSAGPRSLAGVRKACQGRPVGEDDLALLAQRVEEAVRATGSAEVDAHEVGLATLEPLRELDEVAYLRFASRLPGLRLAGGLRVRHHAAARRARPDRGRAQRADRLPAGSAALDAGGGGRWGRHPPPTATSTGPSPPATATCSTAVRQRRHDRRGSTRGHGMTQTTNGSGPPHRAVLGPSARRPGG